MYFTAASPREYIVSLCNFLQKNPETSFCVVLGKWCWKPCCQHDAVHILPHWNPFFSMANIRWFGSKKKRRSKKMSGNQATLQIALWPPSLRCSLLCPENISWIERVLTVEPSWLWKGMLWVLIVTVGAKVSLIFCTSRYVSTCFNPSDIHSSMIIGEVSNSLPSFPSSSVN